MTAIETAYELQHGQASPRVVFEAWCIAARQAVSVYDKEVCVDHARRYARYMLGWERFHERMTHE